MLKSDNIDLRFTGDFSLAASVSLAASASFVEALHGGQGSETGVLDLVFALEGSWSTVGVRVEEHDGATAGDVRAQIERILSLDGGGADFADVGTRDVAAAGLQQLHPGLCPVLFPSPYEAAARAIIGHRLHVKQAAAVTTRIAEEHGAHVDVGEHVMHAFPAPDRISDLPPVRGLAGRKVEQLRALGVATADGRLGSARLRAMERDEALSHLQQLSRIGPFPAELVLLRGVGDTDASPRTEKRLHRAMIAAYHLGHDPNLDVLERVADRWRPYRSWVGLLLRNFWEDDSRAPPTGRATYSTR